MATRASSPSSEHRDARHPKGEITTLDHVFRGFRGVNCTGPRESIGDDEFYWLENIVPKSPGNLVVAQAAVSKTVNYAKNVVFECTASIGAATYIFAFLSDGSGSYNTVGSTSTTQFAAPGAFTTPVAIPYTSFSGNAGILIIDPANGYFDFSVTTSLTLTALSNAAANASVGYTNSSLSPIAVGFSNAGAGTGFVGHGNYAINAVISIVFGGTGYQVKDILQVIGGNGLVTNAQLQVSAVNSSGAITGVVILNAGNYAGPTTAAITNVGPPNPATVNGGAGSGATFQLSITCTGYTIVNPGHGYTASFSVQDTGGAPFFRIFDVGTVTVSGSLNGTALAAYAGRVWVVSGNTISFTDINSYNSFGGAGGSLTISDSYMSAGITALFAANGFLYIFGAESIDTLSNVQITSGVTSFSRVNLTQSIGTTFPQSVFTYFRSVAFANSNGFYLLSGATPQKISNGLDALFNGQSFLPTSPAQFLGGLVAGNVTLFGELCMCWTLRIVDGFTTLYGTRASRTLIVVFFQGKWFFYYPGFDIGQLASIPVSPSQIVLYGFGTTGALYQLFAAQGTTMLSFMQTKLWDGGDPITDKEVLRAALGIAFGSNVNQALTVTTDNEYNSSPVNAINDQTNAASAQFSFLNNSAQVLQFRNNSLQNLFFFGSAFALGTNEFLSGVSSTMGGKYFGLSVRAQQTDIVFSLLAEQFRETRPW